MNREYIIWTPAFVRRNGIRVLHLLSEKLTERGYKASLYSGEPFLDRYKYTHEITSKLRKNAIIIYPETVKGNPLRFKNVVRYVLYYPGQNGGHTSYHQSESVFAYLPEFYPDYPVLTIPWIDEELFYNDNAPKTQDCYFINKGGKFRDAKETEGLLELNMGYPKTIEELASILKRTKTLYSYDNCTAILDEAYLCGANVKIIIPEGVEDFKSTYVNYLEGFENQLDNFIELTQNKFYKGTLEKRNKINFQKWTKDYFSFLLYKYVLKNTTKSIRYKNRLRGF